MSTSFDRETTQRFREEFNKYIADFAKKWGVNIEIGRITMSYTLDQIRTQMTVTSIGEQKTGVPTDLASTKDGRAFVSNAPLYGFLATDLGTSIKVRGESYRIVGWLPRSHRMPVLIESPDGKHYKYSIESVLAMVKLRDGR